MRAPAKTANGNAVDAHELVLFGVNDATLYRTVAKPIIKNLARKMLKGLYDDERALKAWRQWADAATITYNKEHGPMLGHGHYGFAPATRNVAGQEAAEHYAEELEYTAHLMRRDQYNRRMWTLADIKAQNTAMGFCFFSRQTMRFFGDTMDCFRAEYEDGRIFVVRVKPGSKGGPNMGRRREFNPETGEIGPCQD